MSEIFQPDRQLGVGSDRQPVTEKCNIDLIKDKYCCIIKQVFIILAYVIVFVFFSSKKCQTIFA